MKTRILFLLAFVAMCFTAVAQVQVKGTVVSAKDSEPMIGVQILEQGTSNGTITDIDGNFSLNVKPNASLVVSYVGYNTQTLKASSNMTIRLEEDSKLLDDVVVIGYGTQRKSDLTGAVAQVKAEDLKDLSTTDAAAALQGKAAGLHIINNGGPGQASEIRVRGYSSNSTTSSNISPLLIVDGLQVSSIQYLDPSMIESMEVLKDAASAAIYGAQAGNGVVLITTKTGRSTAGRANVTYSVKATLQDYHKRPQMRRDEFLEYMNLKFQDNVSAEDQAAGVKYMDKVMKDNGDDGLIDTDWISAYFEPAWSQQHSLSVSGGNDKGHYFTSLNWVNNDGIVKGSKDVYKRLTAQINADYKIANWLKVGNNTSIEKWSTKSVSQRGYSSSFESLLLMDPLTPVYWTSPEEMSKEVYNEYIKVQNGTATVPYRFIGDKNGWFANTKYSDAEGSPLAKRDVTDAKVGGINVNGTLFADFTPIKGLTITSRLGYRIAQSTSHSYTAPYYIGSRGSNTDYSISANANTSYYYQWENFANYMFDINKNNFLVMVGMSYRENNYDNVSASSSGKDILSDYSDNFLYLDYVKSDAAKSIGNAPGRSSSIAYFGRLTYNYDNRYNLQVNFRADAFDSSKLPSANRWGYFPSLSAGWTISNESFFKDNLDPSIFSFAKFRASWGQNGNIGVLNNYPYASTISLASNWYQYHVDENDVTWASAPSGLANKDLKWETSEQIDLGLDLRFLDNRLTATIDYFDKKTKDLLFSIEPTAEVGMSSTVINGGTVLNRGLEFELGWKDRIGDFNYSISSNLSTLHNEVLDLPAGVPKITKTDASSTNYQVQTVFEKGQPVWYLRGYKYAGIDATSGAPLYYTAEGEKVGTNEVGDNDMDYLGQGTPKFTYGINISMEYKGVDLRINGYGQGGNVIMPVLHRTGIKNHLSMYMDLYKDGTYPHPSKTAGDLKFWSSDANVFKGDFFRIKQLQLGYTLPREITKKIAINNLRVYVSLDDYITFTKYKGLDPETASTNTNSGLGLDWGSYPTMQKLIFGLNVTF